VELLLLLLLARGWARKFHEHEQALEAWYRGTLSRSTAVEVRASEALRGGVGFKASGGKTVIDLNGTQLRQLKSRLTQIYGSAISAKGSLGRRAMKQMEASRGLGRSHAREQMRTLEKISASLGLPTVLNVDAVKGLKNLDPQTKFALIADIESMATSAVHRASVGASSLRGADALALGSTRAKLATGIPKSSLQNTYKGNPRRAYREGVGSLVGPGYAGWMGYSTVQGGVLERLSTEQWAVRARVNRSSERWLPGNPTTGFGMHVGSRTYFVPVPSETIISSVALAMLLILPKLDTDAESTISAEIPRDAPTVETLQQQLWAVVQGKVAGMSRYRVPQPAEDQEHAAGHVAFVIDDTSPTAVVVDFPVPVGTIIEIQDAKGTVAQIRTVHRGPWSSWGGVIFLRSGASVEVGNLATTRLVL
jgi:hypothetical protein